MGTHSSVLAWRIPGTGGAWWSAVYAVAQSQTRLSDLAAGNYIPQAATKTFVVVLVAKLV